MKLDRMSFSYGCVLGGVVGTVVAIVATISAAVLQLRMPLLLPHALGGLTAVAWALLIVLRSDRP